MTSRAFGSSRASGSGTTRHSFGTVLSITAFSASAAARSRKTTGADGAIFAWLALLARKTREALRTLCAFCTSSTIQTRGSIMTRTSRGSHRARRSGGQPVLDLIFNMRVKRSDAGNFAIQTVHFVLDVVELVDDSLVAVRAGLGERAASVALDIETCHSDNH